MLFTEPSGGTLPFFGLAAIALLLFGPEDWRLAALGAVLPALLFTACKTGLAGTLLDVTPHAAPDWYFAANAVTTFALAFLVRSSSSLERPSRGRAAAPGPREAQTRD